jgi:FkbM family methyltransferase
MSATQLVKSWMRRLGLVVQRWPATRFNATDTALALLRRSGFSPDLVIDVGANRGQWTTLAREIFPDAAYHLVEPQRGCQPFLARIADGSPRTHVHATAVTRPGISTVVMVGGGEDQTGTGNFIPTGSVSKSEASSYQPTPYASTTLDSLFCARAPGRVLLKLDVEGHELAALEGAHALLQRTEVVLTEFWMFRIADEDMATFTELVVWLEQAGFVLYDFGALQGRRSDNRLTSGDAMFVRRDSPLVRDSSWQ